MSRCTYWCLGSRRRGQWVLLLIQMCVLTCPFKFFLQDFHFPDNVAFPIGGEGAAQYIILETHYDNPHKVAGE